MRERGKQVRSRMASRDEASERVRAADKKSVGCVRGGERERERERERDPIQCWSVVGE